MFFIYILNTFNPRKLCFSVIYQRIQIMPRAFMIKQNAMKLDEISLSM